MFSAEWDLSLQQDQYVIDSFHELNLIFGTHERVLYRRKYIVDSTVSTALIDHTTLTNEALHNLDVSVGQVHTQELKKL